MSVTDRILVAVGILALSVVVAGAGTAAWLAHAYGTVEVSVVSTRGDGDDVSIRLPGALVRLGAEIIPRETLGKSARDIREWLPVARAAVSELTSCPDGLLVHVKSHGETVRITKRGGALLAEVSSPTENVRVSIPLAAAGAVLDEIGESAGEAAEE